MNINLDQKKLNTLLLELLINLTVEVTATRNLITNKIILADGNEDGKELIEFYRELRKESHDSIVAIIKNSYGLDDIDGIINNVFK